MNDDDLNRLLYCEQEQLLLARAAGSHAKRQRHRAIAHIFGRRVCALRYPYRDSWSNRWAPYDPSPLGAA
ncbi:MAG: hypothetical protein J7494_01750 [Sphingobium sp.]|nr:hypothetical protein [Sphingobium sp.]